MLDRLVNEFARLGGDRAVLSDPSVAHLAVEGSRVLSGREVEGLSVRTKEREDGVDIDVSLAPGSVLERPVHMCFGVMRDRGVQRLNIRVRLGEGARADFIAHCMFPDAVDVLHAMDAEVDLGPGSHMSYREAHYHGRTGGVRVEAASRVMVGTGAVYTADFSLLEGLVGSLNIDISADAGQDSVVELQARVFGHARDLIRINESVVLSGARSRSLIKTRVALEGEAQAEIRGSTEGRAPMSRGHVDCTEIVRERARASAVPAVTVVDPLSKVTHEAAIGSVDKAQMETLCARGLTPEDAAEVIVRGLLR